MTASGLSRYIADNHPIGEIRLPMHSFNAAVCVLGPTLSEQDDSFWYRGVRFILDHEARPTDPELLP